jgi:hypothetical protein
MDATLALGAAASVIAGGIVGIVGTWIGRRQLSALVRETATADGRPTVRRARTLWLSVEFASEVDEGGTAKEMVSS